MEAEDPAMHCRMVGRRNINLQNSFGIFLMKLESRALCESGNFRRCVFKALCTNALVYTDSLLLTVLLSHLYSVAVQLYSICLYVLEKLINTGQRLIRLFQRVLYGFVCAEA